MVKYLRPIDTHVHLRWTEYPNHDFMKLGFRDAKKVGLSGLIVEPNTKPAINDWNTFARYLARAEEYRGDIIMFAHLGLTNDEQQVMQVLHAISAGMSAVRSEKTFYADSTSDTGVKSWADHAMLWRAKRKAHYRGVSTGHFENENLFVAPYIPHEPDTHADHRPEISEVTQVEAQLRLAYDNKFEGTFYINHVSSPDTVDLVQNVRKMTSLPFQIALEVTWHHMLLNLDHVHMLGEAGNLLKMNPPLRAPHRQEEILHYVLQGKFDTIGSDHAPHPLETKSGDSPKSGIPALPFLPKGVELLRLCGIPEETLENLLFHNANRIFTMGEKPRAVETHYEPSLWEAYGWNPFAAIDGTK